MKALYLAGLARERLAVMAESDPEERVRRAARSFFDEERARQAIEEARLWRRRSNAKLTPVEDAFLAAGFKLADRAANRKRLFTTVTIVVLAAVALGAVLAMLKIRDSGQRAQRESARAKKERQRAVNEIAANIDSYLSGGRRCRIV